LNFLGTLGENQLTINIRVYFRIFNSIPILDVHPYAYYFDYARSNYSGTNAEILKANTELYMYMQGYDRAYIEDMVKAN